MSIICINLQGRLIEDYTFPTGGKHESYTIR